MDIPAISTALSQIQVRQQATVSVLKMTMQLAENNGEMLNAMLAGSTKDMGNLIRPDLGSMVDVYA